MDSFFSLFIILLFSHLPEIALLYFVISLGHFIRAGIKNKKLPNSIPKEKTDKYLLHLIISSAIMFVIIVAYGVIIFIVMTNEISFM